MSIIQRIRDKAAWLIIVAIALAMIGFIVTDAFQGGGRGLFSSNSTTLGEVNGKEIDYVVFQTRVTAQEQQYPGGMNDMLRQNLQENLWNQMVEEKLMEDVYDDLGYYITDREISDILFGANPPQQLRQAFVDANGQYDAGMADRAIKDLQKKNPKEYQAFMNSIIGMRQREKYLSLLVNSTYLPKWMAEKANADNSQLATISYISVPYITVSDSAVTVTDEDVKDYVSKRPDEFKQEVTRSVTYVAFNAAPSSADTAAIVQQVTNLKTEFDTTTQYQGFLVRNGSKSDFADQYVTQSNLQVPYADSIRSLQPGQVYGPYFDAGSVVLAKMIDKRQMPDTIKVRHILISTQNGTPDSVAKRRIDSAANAIAGGANFAAVAAAVSDDPGSKDKGGEYEFTSIQFSNLAKEFAEVAFYGNKGDKKTVKTSLGYHYMEVLDQKKIEPAYKVAYFTKEVLPSTETENRASGLANQFAGQSRKKADFDKNVEKDKSLTPIIASDIRPTDPGLPNLGSNRQLVRWIYEADLGDVSEPFVVGDKYVVATVTEINKEGLVSPAKARPMVEVIIRNKKKAEQIIKKIGTPATLEAAASAAGQPIQRADSVSFAAANLPNAGQEPKVVGAAFNKSWQGKVTPPVAGNNSVFVLRPESVFAGPNPSADLEQQRSIFQMQQRNAVSYRAIEALKKDAKIKDYRGLPGSPL